MRTSMRPLVLLVPILTLAMAACSSQEVQKATTCSDPCCGGNANRLDCSESPDVTCTASGDPCTAPLFGCQSGVFFMEPQTHLPASCTADSGLDGTLETDATEPVEGAAVDATAEATTYSGPDATSDAAPEATSEAGTEAAADAAPDAASDAP
jgi:hypothetical protein